MILDRGIDCELVTVSDDKVYETSYGFVNVVAVLHVTVGGDMKDIDPLTIKYPVLKRQEDGEKVLMQPDSKFWHLTGKRLEKALSMVAHL